jgi:DNA-binding winged helix-turn-helix (wHTH) protein/TolB-like protein
MNQPQGLVYNFGPFRYDAAQRVLFRESELVPLAPKAVDTLHVLLERRGRVVGKSELMKLVWPATTVEEVGLARNISMLRKALGDEGEGGTYIETIPRRGYRFVGTVQVAPVEAGAPARANVSRASRQRPMMMFAAAALLGMGLLIYWQFYMPSRYLPSGAGFAALATVPFECLTPEPDCAAFSRGLNELLVAELSKLSGVQVVSPSTVRRHQHFGVSMGLMGRLLGLDVLVEGTVEKMGDRRRITSRLVDVHTGKVIWAEEYDEFLADTGQTEAKVARAIAQQAGARLVVRRAPAQPRR